ncbi:MAG: hypothetical protein SPI59_06150 [Finegoldia sp.]|nr:hypothetical protein [Finegoldia sp.]
MNNNLKKYENINPQALFDKFNTEFKNNLNNASDKKNNYANYRNDKCNKREKKKKLCKKN